MLGRVFVSRPAFGLEEGVEGAGQRLSFSIPRGRKAREGEERRGLPGAGSWPDTEILVGKGSGHSPPTAALLEMSVGRVDVSG